VTGTYDLGVFLEDVAGSAAPLTGGGVTGEAGPNQDVATATDVSTSWRAVGWGTDVVPGWPSSVMTSPFWAACGTA